MLSSRLSSLLARTLVRRTPQVSYPSFLWLINRASPSCGLQNVGCKITRPGCTIQRLVYSSCTVCNISGFQTKECKKLYIAFENYIPETKLMDRHTVILIFFAGFYGTRTRSEFQYHGVSLGVYRFSHATNAVFGFIPSPDWPNGGKYCVRKLFLSLRYLYFDFSVT